MTETQALLADFVKDRSEAAFRELVARYLNLVYSTALRLVGGDAHRAEDVAQSVFLHLAQKAHTLAADSALGGWLHRDTCHVAATLMRGERRRQLREQHAAAMNSLPDHSEANLAQLAPVLDEAINELGAEDRTAILLRFYEQRDLRSVGEALGSSENAAQKRVARALEELRSLLKHRGVALSAAALGTILAADVVTAAPAGLVTTISAGALTSAAKGSGTITLLKFMATANLKTAAIAAVVLAGVLTPLFLQHQASARIRDQDFAINQQSNQITRLADDNRRLALLGKANDNSNASDPQLDELLKLRSEVGRLQRTVVQMKAADPAHPLSPEEKLAYLKSKYATQVARLKDWLDAHPNEKIPELDHLSDDYWLNAVDALGKEDNFESAMSFLRANAEMKTLSLFVTALKPYLKANNNEFPTDLSQLTPYLKTPIDEAILQRYAIVPANTLVTNLQPGSDLVITEVAPVNPALDCRDAYGLDPQGRITGAHASESVTNLWNSIR